MNVSFMSLAAYGRYQCKHCTATKYDNHFLANDCQFGAVCPQGQTTPYVCNQIEVYKHIGCLWQILTTANIKLLPNMIIIFWHITLPTWRRLSSRKNDAMTSFVCTQTTHILRGKKPNSQKDILLPSEASLQVLWYFIPPKKSKP